VRENRGGKLFTLIYGKASSVANDPIEKKPLYHFHPGTNALSFGSVGCNLKCLFCQNYTISQVKYGSIPMRDVASEDVLPLVERYGSAGVAWTYNEPSIWHEFTYDASKLVKEAGYYSVYVTNGYINEDPLREIAPYLDAMNVDIKSFTEDFYRKLCKGRLQPVLDTCIVARELGIHIELTKLVVPDSNDSPEETKEFCRWVVDNLGDGTPVHFSRFHPDYKMRDRKKTPMEALDASFEIAQEEGLKYIYVGNIPHDARENTYCPDCGGVVIERWGFSIGETNMDGNKCSACGAELDIVTRS
jgi:pyruvate formate lyase activating enzyme